jgi:25S rRNA (adenine2142-N1)-methyltransferase
VGAIDNQYLDFTWFDAFPIDLNAQHPSVRAIDFFDFAQEHMLQQPRQQPFDAIVQSLVLNFQGDPRRRGDMLALAADPRMLATNGLLFVALPSASLENSRYCTVEHFVGIAGTLGLRALEIKKSAKLILLTFTAERRHLHARAPRLVYDTATRAFDYPTEVGRKEVHSGKTRNNFAVMLKSTR